MLWQEAVGCTLKHDSVIEKTQFACHLHINTLFHSTVEVQIRKVCEIAEASGILAETILVKVHFHTDRELDMPTGPITEELPTKLATASWPQLANEGRGWLPKAHAEFKIKTLLSECHLANYLVQGQCQTSL